MSHKATSSVKAFGANIPVRRSAHKSPKDLKDLKDHKKKSSDAASSVCIPPTLLYKSKSGELVKSRTITCSELDVYDIKVEPEEPKVLSIIGEASDEGSTGSIDGVPSHTIIDVD
jgi:hypothetical protein